MVTRGLPVAQRFWVKVKTRGPDDCWPWLVSLKSDGYGSFWVNRDRGTIAAHRFAWILTHGDPAGLHVLHRCDNRKCVNLAHLFLGTNADNVADRVAKGREGNRAGEANGRAKLTAKQVSDIRSQYKGEFGEKAALARQFGLGKSQMGDILNGKKWLT